MFSPTSTFNVRESLRTTEGIGRPSSGMTILLELLHSLSEMVLTYVVGSFSLRSVNLIIGMNSY